VTRTKGAAESASHETVRVTRPRWLVRATRRRWTWAHRYTRLFQVPHGKTLLVAAFIGQMPIGMIPLSLLLLISQRFGSYSAAGLVVAAYSAASAIVAPIWGRFMDRFGPRPVLVGMSITYLCSLAAFVALVSSTDSLSLIVASVVVVGTCRPVLSGAVQALWARLVREGALRKRAYALHTLELETVWVVGSILVTVLVALFGRPAGLYVALVLAGFLAALGALVTAAIPQAREAPAETPQAVADDRSLYTTPYLLFLATVALFEIAAGSGIVAITEFGERSGALTTAGVLIALWAGGSIVAGVWFGARHFALPLPVQYRRCLLLLASSYALFAFLTSPWLLAVGLFVGGVALAPTFTVQYSLVPTFAPPRARTEGFTWLETLAAAGGSVGAALGGSAIDHLGEASAAFFVSAACVFVSAGLAMPAVLGRAAR
jgi:MFS family permease